VLYAYVCVCVCVCVCVRTRKGVGACYLGRVKRRAQRRSRHRRHCRQDLGPTTLVACVVCVFVCEEG
jgi:hypothetical protein